ncbi:hypothetical protein ASPZODRAFT_142639 [Penicilliopsis zonata CBS 506.65]|uniref:O-methyltransferase C-terminal domain-containing protein n=1 Tax=Penicilliopsis zonata CBS 506.65 TaxID=1073090 RepID=A0A1L9SFQ5_9EURO|nr:hypothetical protein ASPZODRAFT_142639 [Penicilliopsis zonata CBS 506.65]OJJ46002.1 hypothetical protein ASPZODRAFT_142639 [Penicilliopsis zonata CBS 506.65]
MDPSSVAAQNAAIRAQLAHVTALVEEYCAISTEQARLKELSIEQHGRQSGSHTAVVREAHKLLNTIKGPLDTVFCHFENGAHTGAVRALFDMGMFQALPAEGSKTAEQLSKELNAEKELIIRLMRMTTVWGPFKEVGVEEYAHTPDSLIYLVPEVNGIFTCLVDEYKGAELRFNEFFKLNGWVNPIQERNNPYTFHHRTQGKNMWEHMVQFPDRFRAFNYAMQAQSSAASWAVGLYPFRETLAQLGTTDETPLVIDIGGGKGHTLAQIQGLVGPGIKGRFILQERPQCLADITEELPGIERQEYDFFTPQKEKGAMIYYLRRIFHDWPHDVCVQILRNIAAGITDKTKQRVVIADDILPEQGADAEGAWMDLIMMTLTGTERTEKQWRELLDEAGWKLTRTFVGPGTNYAAVEAVLK